MDVLGIAVDVFSAAVVGQSFLKDLKALDRARTMELHPACFIAGTQVTVQGEDGEEISKPIEEIEAGDRVLATDAETGATEYKEVVHVFVKESDTLVLLTVNGEEITTTPDHPFRVGDDWIASGDLREGDLLTLADGTTAPLEKIRIETLDAPVTVYNFEVADFHTYYVGNTQILVHNDCKSGSATPDIGTGGNKTSVAGESKTVDIESTNKVLNSKGVPYPDVEVSGYGKVKLPSGPYAPNNSTLLRSKFTNPYKEQFKTWWIEQGRIWPEGEVNVHHIKPLSKGGDNSFENLVPLIQPDEHQPFTSWWRNYP